MIKEIWGRFVVVFFILVGGLLGWLITLLIFAATMFLIVPLLWVASMVVILVRGFDFRQWVD